MRTGEGRGQKGAVCGRDLWRMGPGLGLAGCGEERGRWGPAPLALRLEDKKVSRCMGGPSSAGRGSLQSYPFLSFCNHHIVLKRLTDMTLIYLFIRRHWKEKSPKHNASSLPITGSFGDQDRSFSEYQLSLPQSKSDSTPRSSGQAE